VVIDEENHGRVDNVDEKTNAEHYSKYDPWQEEVLVALKRRIKIAGWMVDWLSKSTYDYGTDDDERRQDYRHTQIHDQDDFYNSRRKPVVEQLKRETKNLHHRKAACRMCQRRLTTVLKSMRVVRITTMVTMLSKMPRVPAMIVPVFRLLHPQHVVNLCGCELILYFSLLFCVCDYFPTVMKSNEIVRWEPKRPPRSLGARHRN
jgi:hypothetical protein